MNAPMPPEEREALEGRLPPHSIEAEQCVLGGLLLDNNALDLVVDVVQEGHFYRADHRLLFRTIVGLLNRNQPADVITVWTALEAAGEPFDLAYLNDLAQNTPSAANARGYATMVRERAMLRGLMQVCQRGMDAAMMPAGRNAEQVIAEVEGELGAVMEDGLPGDGEQVALSSLITSACERIQSRHEDPTRLSGVSTGFDQVDEATDGLQGGDMIIVAGRPSMGKTTFALNIAENVALAGGIVGVFSMEMGGQQLAMRMLSSIGRVDGHAMKRGKLNDADFNRLAYATEKLQVLKLEIDERPALRAGQIRAKCKYWRRKHGKLDLVVVDYLQLMSAAGGRGENRNQEVSEISRNIKGLAKEMGCPIIVLSQLNRALENRSDKRPSMGDLRDSGAIEQDADVILFLYRDEVYNPNTEDRGYAEVIMGKARNDALDSLLLEFKGQFTRFENTPRQYRAPRAPRSAPSKSFAEKEVL